MKILNYKKSGNPFWNMFTLAPIQDIDGTVRFFVGVQASGGIHAISDEFFIGKWMFFFPSLQIEC